MGQLVSSFETEWPDHFSRQPPGEAERGFALGQWLVYSENDECFGAVVLRDHPLPELDQLKPALGGLWVTPARRGKGIGTALVKAAMQTAAAQGMTKLYVATHNAGRLFERAGWSRVDTLVHDGEPIGLYEVSLP